MVLQSITSERRIQIMIWIVHHMEIIFIDRGPVQHYGVQISL